MEKVEFPLPTLSSSGAYQDNVVSNLLTGVGGWNSGGHPIQWFEIDFKREVEVASLVLVTEQLPSPCWTEHVVTGGSEDNPTLVLCEFKGETKTRQILSATDLRACVRYLRVTTTKSLSWVAWHKMLVDYKVMHQLGTKLDQVIAENNANNNNELAVEVEAGRKRSHYGGGNRRRSLR